MDKNMLAFYKGSLLGHVSGTPLCDEYRDLWRGCGDDKEKLMRLVLRQQSLPFAIHAMHNNIGLTKEYVTHAFEPYINGRYCVQDVDGVQGYTYALNAALDEDCVITTDVAAFVWCDDIEVTIRETKTPILYIGCKSKVHLVLGGYNTPMIYLFDESTLVIDDADEVSKVLVYKYSPNAKVEKGKFCFSDVRVFDKELKL